MTKERPQKTAGNIIRDITGSNFYLEEYQEIRKRGIGSVALKPVIDRLVEKERSAHHNYDTDYARQLKLTGSIPGWLDAQTRLDTEDYADEEEKDKLLDTVIDVNDLVAEMIDSGQYDSELVLTGFVEEYLLMSGADSETIEYASGAFKHLISGMRQEVAAESAINEVPGVNSVRRSSRAEEKEGIDLVVDYLDFPLVFLDTKSSKLGAEDANKKARSGDTNYIIWTGFSNHDFGDRLTLPMQVIRGKVGHYQELLDSITNNRTVVNY